jgi:sugar lactone lactonase YvrE
MQAVGTLAGCSQPGTADGPRGSARFNNPTNIVIASGGIAYATDFDSSRVRVIDAAGTTKTVFEDPTFARPFGIVLAPDGTLYVETDDNDFGEHTLTTGTIWHIDPVKQTGVVIARNLGRPRGLALLADGRLALSDHLHHVITILDPSTGVQTPLAGMYDIPGHANGVGRFAQFAQPYDLVALPDGTLAVADMENHRIRRVALDGIVSDLAGNDGVGALNGPANVATFAAPQALAMLPDGTLFVTDISTKLIRRIANGMVETVAGDGTPGYLDAALPRNARFYGLEGMDADASRLLIADGNIGDGMPYHHIRLVRLANLP